MFRVMQSLLQSNSVARSLDRMLSDLFGNAEPHLAYASLTSASTVSGDNEQSAPRRRRKRRKRPVSDGTSFRTSWF